MSSIYWQISTRVYRQTIQQLIKLTQSKLTKRITATTNRSTIFIIMMAALVVTTVVAFQFLRREAMQVMPLIVQWMSIIQILSILMVWIRIQLIARMVYLLSIMINKLTIRLKIHKRRVWKCLNSSWKTSKIRMKKTLICNHQNQKRYTIAAKA